MKIQPIKKNGFQINRKKMRGAVAVEMALLLIPLIIMAVGVAEFGRAMYEYNTLAKAVRDSVRYIPQRVPKNPNDLTDPVYVKAKCLAVYGVDASGEVACDGTPLLLGLNESMVTIVPPDTSSGNSDVTVTITGYQFQFVFNPLVFFGNTATFITFGDIHATMRLL